ncbi:YczE/YyaS/YitT family protein [Blautia hydrogenotrophica]|uniref:YczE/YyaS/YitT family protein n=1 Tax=Blautia hydrogenotrophica TaxID=53443 RepID=UPI002E781B53|nr:DUF6198 family protein [Blautia hydrogenotrophica]MEE0463218.1 DUF6198 family protein [Blautia hydrogenotrophica]
MKNNLLRYFWFVAGILINSFGVALITKAALGTSPISSLPYVLSLQFPMTLGQFTFILNMVFILLEVILLKKDFHAIQYLQIAVNVLFSFCIDVSMNLLFFFEPANLAVQFAALIVGCTILALGISIEVAPDVLVVPGEGVVKAISQVSRRRFGTVKVIFDTTLVIGAAFLSFLFFHRLSGLGIGTILSACIVGRFVNLINRHLPLISQIASLRQKPNSFSGAYKKKEQVS